MSYRERVNPKNLKYICNNNNNNNNNNMNVLILGSGGREHAFALKLSESNKINELFVAPGNAGTHKIAKNITINITDFQALKKLF